MKYFLLSVLAIFILVTSCDSLQSEDPDNAIISFSGYYLLKDEINQRIPSGLSKADSLTWLEDYKKQWLKNHIIIEKAKNELPKSQLNIEPDVVQYTADLLMYKYESFYVKNKINTKVSPDEIKTFYSENEAALKSTKVLVKATYVEVLNSVKDRYKVAQWLPSKSEKNQEKLKAYCFQKAKVFDDFEGEWIELNSLKKISNAKEFSKSKISLHKVIQVQNDSTTQYFLIIDVINKGSLLPMKYAKQEIVRAIMNKRKSLMFDELNEKINQTVEKELIELSK